MYYLFQSLNVSFALCDSRRMVVGFHPLAVCEENKEQVEAKQFFEPLHHIFVKFGVVSIWSLYLMFPCEFQIQNFEFLYLHNSECEGVELSTD